VRIDAVEGTCSAVWHHWYHDARGHPLLALGVWTEKRAGLGEDAEPLLLHHRDSGYGLLAVFDGAGGAGAASAGRSDQGVERTGAWAGSRAARAATEEWFHDTTEGSRRRDPDGLRDHLATRLGQMRAPDRRKIIGTMRRELPTTLAALDYWVAADRTAWRVLWAGDSRCYLLDPAAGLQQLSRDDTDVDDALVALVEDPPMTNLLAADREFRVNAAHGEITGPGLLLCATDGFFGYVRSPADFEHVLLGTLVHAETAARWTELLVESVRSYTADDASLVLLGVGFDGFADLRQRYARRAAHVADAYWRPVRHAADGERAELVAARESSWARYRRGYEQRLPVKPEVGWSQGRSGEGPL